MRNRKISEKNARKTELQDEINFTHDPPSAKLLMSPATSAEKQIILSERASRNQTGK